MIDYCFKCNRINCGCSEMERLNTTVNTNLSNSTNLYTEQKGYFEDLKDKGYYGPGKIGTLSCSKCKNNQFFFKTKPPVSADEPSIMVYACSNPDCQNTFSTYKEF